MTTPYSNGQSFLPLVYSERMAGYSSVLLEKNPFDRSAYAHYQSPALNYMFGEPIVYYHIKEPIHKSFRINSLSSGFQEDIWFMENLPLFHLGDEYYEPEVFCFSHPPHYEIWGKHFAAFLEQYALAQFSTTLHPQPFHRVNIINGRVVESFHPYVLLYYERFLVSDHEIVKRVKALIDEIITLLWVCAKTNFRTKFAHWCIDKNFALPGPIELLTLHNLLPRIPQEPTHKYSYVYVIRQKGNALVKIGRTTDPQSRLKNLQIGSGAQLSLEYVWEVDNATVVEKLLHDLFKDYRQQGEWFLLSHTEQAELLAYMQQYKRIEL